MRWQESGEGAPKGILPSTTALGRQSAFFCRRGQWSKSRKRPPKTLDSGLCVCAKALTKGNGRAWRESPRLCGAESVSNAAWQCRCHRKKESRSCNRACPIPVCGKIELLKKREDGSLLSSAVFGVDADSACKNLVTMLTARSNGKAISDDLELSAPYLKEISAVEPYILSDTLHPVTVKASETAIVPISNQEAMGCIRVKKINSEKIGGRNANSIGTEAIRVMI